MGDEKELDSAWLDEILGAPEAQKDIGPDEQAVYMAGLTHPGDAEVEKIIEESHAEDISDATMTFTPPTEEIPEIREAPEVPQETPKKHKAEKEGKAVPAKGKKKKKNDVKWFGIPHLLVTIIWLLVILIIGAILGRTAWVFCSDLMAFGKPDQEVTVQITEDDDIASIARKLSDAELIRYPELFKTFANLTKKSSRISVGTFTLNSKYDYNAMINAMIIRTTRQEVEVTIPEGYNCAQIFALLEEKGVCSASELEKYAASGDLGNYWFLTGVTRGDRYCLEGYLFPDTYRFYTSDKPANVINKMLGNFDGRFTSLMRERLISVNDTFAEMLRSHGYGEDYIASHKITIREVVIIASLIEKETASVDESHTIASVIYNRLSNASAYPFLNIDAALVYALGGKTEKLTEQDKQLNSPYNTYLHKGLVPGPIANPGRESLNAALDPDATDYYYYAYDPTTYRHHFSQTYEQHQAFLSRLK